MKAYIVQKPRPENDICECEIYQGPNGGYATIAELVHRLVIVKDGQTVSLTGDEAVDIYNMLRPPTAPKASHLGEG